MFDVLILVMFVKFVHDFAVWRRRESKDLCFRKNKQRSNEKG
jgi:hypothetical protein